MTNKEYVLDTMRRQGREAALALQEKSSSMTGTQINAEDGYIPDFAAAVAAANMLTRKAGQTDGFICRSSDHLYPVLHLSDGAALQEESI